MTDEDVDRLVRDADPHRPGAVAHLDGAQQPLLKEIRSRSSWRRFRPRRPRWWRTAAVVSAAAAITGIVAVPTLLAARLPQESAPAVEIMSPGAAPAVAASAGPNGAGKPGTLLGTGGDHVLLLIGEPGWEVTHVYGFAAAEGTVVFAKGALSLDVTWYQAVYYDSYYQDRLHVSPPAPAAVDGWAGDVFTYSGNDWELMLRPRNDVFAGLRTSGPWSRTDFDGLLAAVERVDARTWLDALPADIVTPERAGRAVAAVLTDVPQPPGFNPSALDIPGVHDRYQFGAQVIGRVGCGWLDEWSRAQKAGDVAALTRAVEALRSSRNWPALQSMQAEGDWPEAFWDLADRVAAGKSPGDYRQGLNCV